jgi:hypothetical protein
MRIRLLHANANANNSNIHPTQVAHFAKLQWNRASQLVEFQITIRAQHDIKSINNLMHLMHDVCGVHFCQIVSITKLLWNRSGEAVVSKVQRLHIRQSKVGQLAFQEIPTQVAGSKQAIK